MLFFSYTICLLLATPACDEAVFQYAVGKQPPSALELVADRMQQTPILKANFYQEKSIKALRRPLKSSGTFLFANGQGVFWHTQKPFDTRFIISDAGIYQKSEDAKPFRIEAAKQPMIAEFNHIFAALFRGDREALEAQFQVHFTGDDQVWQLGLIPKNKMMRKVIEKLVVCGGDTVETIHFFESGGNRTLIALSEIETPAELSNEERSNFEF
jgi:hypothetical protein